MSDSTRKKTREQAEEQCTHPGQWVSHGNDYTTNACWGCLLDAWFRIQEEDPDE